MKTGKHNALTPAQMDAMNSDILKGNHLYAEGDKGRTEALMNIVSVISQDVLKERERVNLRDTEAVRRIAQSYLDSCKRTGLLPSKSGLARALGYSRQGVWSFMHENYNHRTTEFLSILYDAFAEAIDVAALGGSAHPIYSIFIQKAQYEARDNTPVQPLQKRDPLGPRLDEEELRRRIQSYIDLEEDGIDNGENK